MLKLIAHSRLAARELQPIHHLPPYVGLSVLYHGTRDARPAPPTPQGKRLLAPNNAGLAPSHPADFLPCPGLWAKCAAPRIQFKTV